MTPVVNTPERTPQAGQKPPFVSVMILCYNYAHMLGKALEACAAQTFRDFEIVMINNGSTDDTEAVFQRYCKAHPDIRTVYVHVDSNNGPENGWNCGLEQAHGEYVMFNDADDWMDPDCLEQLAQKARQTGADRVSVQYREVLPDGTVVRERKFTPKQQYMALPMIQGMIFRRAVIEKNGLYLPNANGIFYDHCLIMAFEVSKENKSAFIESTHYNYLVNSESEYGKMIREKGSDAQLNRYIEPLVRAEAGFAAKTDNQRLKDEMQYVILRSVLSIVISGYRHLDKKEANSLCAGVFGILDRELPDFRKNPLLWPFGNGYELPGSIAVMAIVLLEKLHATGILSVLRRLGGSTMLTR